MIAHAAGAGLLPFRVDHAWTRYVRGEHDGAPLGLLDLRRCYGFRDVEAVETAPFLPRRNEFDVFGCDVNDVGPYGLAHGLLRSGGRRIHARAFSKHETMSQKQML